MSTELSGLDIATHVDETFLAFCRSKPADEVYPYVSNKNCAFAQFLRETGRATDPRVGGWDWSDGPLGENDEETPIPRLSLLALNERTVLAQRFGVSRGHTFGALADRLAALIEADKPAQKEPA